MENSTAQTPGSSVRRGPVPWMILCLVLASAVLALGGFLTGRAAATGGEDKGGADCSKLKKTAEKLRGETQRLETLEDEPEEWIHSLRTGAYLIKQNPDCFTAEARAKAQATLDQYEDA